MDVLLRSLIRPCSSREMAKIEMTIIETQHELRLTLNRVKSLLVNLMPHEYSAR